MECDIAFSDVKVVLNPILEKYRNYVDIIEKI